MPGTTRPVAPPVSSPAPPALSAPADPPTFASHELFGAATEVRIDHAGVVYRLKRTALGKLILTK